MPDIFCKTRDEWLRARMGGIGGSDAPIAVGESPFKSPFQLWSEKVGLVEPDDLSNNEAVEWGHRLEPVIAEAYAEKAGRRVRYSDPFHIRQHPEHRWMMATLDALQEENDEEGVLQIKTTSAFKAEEWEDEPPLHYQIQLQHEIAVAGVEWGTLCVLIGGQQLRWFDMPRNDKFIEAMIAREAAFWRLVETQEPPDPDGSKATTDVLKRLYPTDNGDSIALPVEAADWDDELERVKEEMAALEQRKDLLENRLKKAIGNATAGVLPDGRGYSYKTQTVNKPPQEAKTLTFRVLRRMKQK
jgi:putative phage-type endonuclease